MIEIQQNLNDAAPQGFTGKKDYVNFHSGRLGDFTSEERISACIIFRH
jgi:hypothetical protein